MINTQVHLTISYYLSLIYFINPFWISDSSHLWHCTLIHPGPSFSSSGQKIPNSLGTWTWWTLWQLSSTFALTSSIQRLKKFQCWKFYERYNLGRRDSRSTMVIIQVRCSFDCSLIIRNFFWIFLTFLIPGTRTWKRKDSAEKIVEHFQSTLCKLIF